AACSGSRTAKLARTCSNSSATRAGSSGPGATRRAASS
ncbi:uncharacterized protein METZ01_LOCUS342292, partial [marine metagenome]